jgi:glycosyltransferase involved in cell wall biosynthesis
MNILLIEPYDTGSHARWMRGYQSHSQHIVEILSLDGQFWQWRMLGGAITLAEQFLERSAIPDLIVVSDMLDLTTFLALTRPVTAHIPIAIYFHENQVNYPRGPRQKQANHYAFINYTSALAANAIFFNSHYHQNAFFDELPRLLKHFPDYTNLHTILQLQSKSRILPVGINLSRYDQFRLPKSSNPAPLVLWNHRWEYDKNPQPFLDAIARLAREGYNFQVAITGENFRQSPAEFEAIRLQLGDRLVQFGFLDSFEAYTQLLWQADMVVSTAIQDFFGISVVEAIYCECLPILPNRLNYPALIPEGFHAQTLFVTDKGLYHALYNHITNFHPPSPALRQHVAQFDWQRLAPQYDAAFEALRRE